MAKTRENRVRRIAERRGLYLTKSRRRDPQALEYGNYWVQDIYTSVLVFGDQWGATLDEVEAWLAAP